VATDLLAQAEHDPRSRAAFVSTDREVAEATVRELEAQLPALRTEEVAREA
jgi:histidinol dehydrogenase/sulfopropanediol 3-dehydrogenase